MPQLRTGGRRLLNFSSNDYLGLARHPEVLAAARRALARWGWGSGASRLVTGTTRAHARLEAALARFHRREAALLFGTGYQANVGALAALTGPGDVLLSDALNHASLIDGCRLSGAAVRVYRHADALHLESLLKRVGGRRAWIVTDAVFSVDGDRAPLGAIADLAERYGARTFVDEAHAIGVAGPHGAGLVAALGLSKRIDVVVGTLSKALGGVGGWVSGSAAVVRWLSNRARAFIFTTAPPAAAAEAALAALALCAGPEGDRRRARLMRHVARLRDALGDGPLLPGDSPILALDFRGVRTAVALSTRLERQGILVAGLRPPTVPAGHSRLRIVPSAAHTPAQVEALVRALRKTL